MYKNITVNNLTISLRIDNDNHIANISKNNLNDDVLNKNDALILIKHTIDFCRNSGISYLKLNLDELNTHDEKKAIDFFNSFGFLNLSRKKLLLEF